MVYRKNVKTSSKHTAAHRRRLLAWALTSCVAVAIIGLALALTHTFPFKSPPPITANPNTKGEGTPAKAAPATDKGVNSSSNQAGTYPSDNKTPADNPTTTTEDKPLTPSGNFVSAHHNIPADAALASSCATSPGATCQIIFTKDGVSKSLSIQTTDAGGGAYWQSWKPRDIGLTPGSWHVQAKAVLHNQTVTADDAATLDIAS